MNLFHNEVKLRVENKILILVEKVPEWCIDGIDVLYLDEEERVVLQKLYHTYEFSNKFSIFSANDNFGTIWNYVKTGFFTPEEALSALLDG